MLRELCQLDSLMGKARNERRTAYIRLDVGVRDGVFGNSLYFQAYLSAVIRSLRKCEILVAADMLYMQAFPVELLESIIRVSI